MDMKKKKRLRRLWETVIAVLVAVPCIILIFVAVTKLTEKENAKRNEPEILKKIETALEEHNEKQEGAIIPENTTETEYDGGPQPTDHEGKVLVTCVGDSNTEGHDGFAYPYVLQAILGDAGIVQNFGAGGTTVSGWSAAPYTATQQYLLSKNTEADYIVIMFGTNDSGDLVWKDKESFKADYKALIDSYLEMNCEPEVILCTPVTPYQTYTDNEGIVQYGFLTDVFPVEIEAINELASEYGLTVIDLYSFTQNHPEWMEADGIHLTAIGYSQIAGQVAVHVQ